MGPVPVALRFFTIQINTSIMKVVFSILLSFVFNANTYAFDWISLSDAILKNHLELFKNNGDCMASIEQNHKLRTEQIVETCVANLRSNPKDTIMMREEAAYLNAKTHLYVWVKGKEEQTLSYFYYTLGNGNVLIAKEGICFSNYIIERIFDEWDLPLIKRILQPQEHVLDRDGYCVLTRLIPDKEVEYRIESMKYSL